MDSPALKEIWLQQCHKWFPREYVKNREYVASAIVHTGFISIFVVFTYDFVISVKNMMQPRFTACVSEKKVMPVNSHGKFLGLCS